MTVRYTSPSAKRELEWQHVSELSDLAVASDVLVLACPGGEATRGIVNAEVLSALGPRGFLVNVARGEVVDETALIAALQTGQIGGAALDVFATEPNIDPRFLELDNVVLQPHYAALTAETRGDIAAMLDRDIDAFLTGKLIFKR